MVYDTIGLKYIYFYRTLVSPYKENFKTFQKRFCENFSQALKDAGMSQRKQLLAGLDPRYLARIKKGEGNPTLMTLWRICNTVGIDPKELFTKK